MRLMVDPALETEASVPSVLIVAMAVPVHVKRGPVLTDAFGLAGLKTAMS